ADRFQYGCTDAALFLTHVPNKLHRAEREQIAAAGYTSFQRIIDTPSLEIVKKAKVSKARLESLQKAIIAALGETLELERRQLARLTPLGVPVAQAEALYPARDKSLEQALEDTLHPPFCRLVVTRIHTQREGEADLRIVLSTGANAIAQVHAKDQPT